MHATLTPNESQTTHLDAFGVYKIFLSLRLHFSVASYDALKYNFKTTAASLEKFRNKPEAHWFNTIAKKYTHEQVIQLFVAQFVSGKKWGGMWTSQVEVETTYMEWLRKIESLTYTFEQDLATIRALFDDNQQEGILADLFATDGGRPFVVMLYQQKRISLETVTLLDILTGFVLKCDSHVTDTILWPKIRMLITKYRPFLKADTKRLKELLLQYFPLRGEAG